LMVFKLEEKEETTVHNVLNLTPVVLINFSLHTYKFSRRLTYPLFVNHLGLLYQRYLCHLVRASLEF
jgi:hypothetical protein